jgi:hypothetical protein
MVIINAVWTPKINLLLIGCQCGKLLWHRTDRWKVQCPCGRTENLGVIRDRYVDWNNP